MHELHPQGLRLRMPLPLAGDWKDPAVMLDVGTAPQPRRGAHAALPHSTLRRFFCFV